MRERCGGDRDEDVQQQLGTHPLALQAAVHGETRDQVARRDMQPVGRGTGHAFAVGDVRSDRAVAQQAPLADASQNARAGASPLLCPQSVAPLPGLRLRLTAVETVQLVLGGQQRPNELRRLRGPR